MGERAELVLILRDSNWGVFSDLSFFSASALARAAKSRFILEGMAFVRLQVSIDSTAIADFRHEIFRAQDYVAAYAALPTAAFTPRLAVFDTDSTFINQEVIDEIADFAGVKPQVARITELAMEGKLDFNAALKERVALLKDLPEDTLAKVLETRLTVTRGGAELIAELTGAGAKTYLLSGGFSFFTSALRGKYRLTGDFANELGIEAGRLTGRTIGPIVNRVRKAELLREIAMNAEIPLNETIAIGDGANDIDMAQASGLGIAFCAKPALAEATNAAIFERDLRLVARLIFPS